MCVKIIGSQELEFNPSKSLESQVLGAKEIVINYDPSDSKIDSFITQVEKMIKSGISCNVDFKVLANNSLNGIRLERYLEKLKLKLEVNELAKNITISHYNTDRKLSELSKICLREIE